MAEPIAAEPAKSEVRIKLSGVVDQRDSGIEVFAKISERKGGAAQYVGIVLGEPKRPLGKIDAFAAVCRRVLGPTDDGEHLVAMCGPDRNPDRARSLVRAGPTPPRPRP